MLQRLVPAGWLRHKAQKQHAGNKSKNFLKPFLWHGVCPGDSRATPLCQSIFQMRAEPFHPLPAGRLLPWDGTAWWGARAVVCGRAGVLVSSLRYGMLLWEQ